MPTPADTTAADGPSDPTGAPGCAPSDVPACDRDACVQQWEFSCDACESFEVDTETCFESFAGCQYPSMRCELPSPCERVWAMGSSMVEAYEDEDAATCLLASLRDGTPGRYTLLYGDMGDIGLVEIELLSTGDGSVMMEYRDTCQGCPTSGFIGRSGALELQPPEYFDDCLADPTTDSLTRCLLGLTEFEPGAPPPADWAPPFTTGTCRDAEWACP